VLIAVYLDRFILRPITGRPQCLGYIVQKIGSFVTQMDGDAMTQNDRLNDDVRAIWDQNADFWDQRMGEGNVFHKLLIEPTQIEFLEITGDDLILDAACGNGQFARKLADLKARVIAVDASERMIENAKTRSAHHAGRIEYRVCDCTDKNRLLTLGERRFDRVVCTMALMDMAEIEPLVSASAKLLKVDGCFVFSVLHPCFNSGMAKQGMERHDIGGELVEDYFVKVARYSVPVTTKGLAMQGQPAPQFYFHRPLATLFQPFFSAGFVLDRLAEPSFGTAADRQRVFDMVFQEIPPALVARFRLSTS
jgi:2-polyprenyl-3-methyl-5-hydroxy-6-metoxy-1,4-benzoquinol methylase